MNKHILTLFLSLTLLLSLAACGGNADTTDARLSLIHISEPTRH